jgi:hypothetical protein
LPCRPIIEKAPRFKKMGHVTIIVINYQQLMNISDIKMTFGINKTVTQADSGNSP